MGEAFCGEKVGGHSFYFLADMTLLDCGIGCSLPDGCLKPRSPDLYSHGTRWMRAESVTRKLR